MALNDGDFHCHVLALRPQMMKPRQLHTRRLHTRTPARAWTHDESKQRASASLPDCVPIESEEERTAREEDEMAALDAVGDYEADPIVMLEDVPQDIVFKTLKVSCACVAVLMFVCVCVCARATS
jgi:hypothetical protein